MSSLPRLSVIIPAYNEADFLPRLLDSIDVARDRYHGGLRAIEVIVADNDSTDDTAEIAHDRGCRVAHVEERRIACARNGGAAIARGEILCFVDADFQIHPETFNAIDAAMSSGHYVGGATGGRMERMSLGIGTALLIVLPLNAFGLDAGVWFCTRDDFDAVGGYDETQLISEDVRFLLALRSHGRSERPRRPMVRLSNMGTFWRTYFNCRLDYDGDTSVVGVRAVISVRKFDKHGDWHFVPIIPRLLLKMLFAPRRFEQEVKAYWYDDR